ncbi:TraR/DksA family transcriptional regulator [Aquipuribacter hungaricus]|uniref:TraR/DksA family transcriptional regulator n=1 Tax=Aquipuribacter hungaricus TaxID=545624 RepID=A0ABV7WC08_9MICO
MTTTPLTHPTPLSRPTPTPPTAPDADLLRQLTDLEETRSRQLQAFPEADLDAVRSARRARAQRDLRDVRTALVRLAEGRYGICTGCDQPISAERLEARCWTTTCVDCAGRAAR